MTIVIDDGEQLVDSRLLLERCLKCVYSAMMKIPYPKWRKSVLNLNLPLRTKHPVDQEVALAALECGRFAELMQNFVLERGNPSLRINIRDTESGIEWKSPPLESLEKYI